MNEKSIKAADRPYICQMNRLFSSVNYHYGFVLAAIIIICTCCSPTQQAEERFVHEHLSAQHGYPFTFENMGTTEEMYAQTQEYLLFLKLHALQFERSALDAISDSLANKLLYELIPQHHLKKQLTEISIGFSTPALAIDSTQYVTRFCKITFSNTYHFDLAGIQTIEHNKSDTNTFETIRR